MHREKTHAVVRSLLAQRNLSIVTVIGNRDVVGGLVTMAKEVIIYSIQHFNYILQMCIITLTAFKKVKQVTILKFGFVWQIYELHHNHCGRLGKAYHEGGIVVLDIWQHVGFAMGEPKPPLYRILTNTKCTLLR